MEEWKDVDGYCGLYQVSSNGRVKRGDRILKNQTCTNRYLAVSLSKNGKVKQFRIHRLVALAFIGKENNKEQVNHKDGNRKNNCVDNLEWVTCSENHSHAVKYLGKKVPKPFKGRFGREHNKSKSFIVINPKGEKIEYGERS